MKFSFSFTASIAAVLGTSVQSRMLREVPLHDVEASSAIGMELLSKARLLANNQNQNNNNMYNADFQFTWVSGYSLKFQGCHHVSQWNSNADSDEDVRVSTKRIVRFRLCPSNSCMNANNKGCSTGYGDYVIDLDTFMSAYSQAQEKKQSYNGENQQGQYQEGQSSMLWQDYTQCTKVQLNSNNNNNNWQYNNQNNNQQQNNNQDYYMGPYCASQGGAIYLGLFMDDSCTSFADSNGGRDVFKSTTGYDLPYGSTSVVSMDCISCKESDGNNQDDGFYSSYYENDKNDKDSVVEYCETLYDKAGKCEESLSGSIWDKNNNACNYMEGIKIVRLDGTVMTAQAKANRSARTVISLLSIAFVGLACYVYHLRSKLDRVSISLNEE